MACLCNKKMDAPTDYDILPDEPCFDCGEKHFATAFAFAEEFGYVPVNRQRIIGELVASCWHVYRDQPGLAVKLRDLRHDVQLRRDVPLSRWLDIAELFDKLSPHAHEAGTVDKQG